jgi:C-terminal processing protease CtpA/Prc
MSEFHSADGIILDLRGNPGGIGGMAMGISGYFLDKPGRSSARWCSAPGRSISS